MPEPMTLEEAVAYLDRLHERAEPESFMETFGDMTNFCAAFDALLAHARATLAQRREGVIAVCAHCGVSVGSDRTIEDGIVTHSRKETCISLLKSQRADRDALAASGEGAA